MIENHNPKFKGVWIPAAIWLNKDLTMAGKLLWGTIDSLCSEDEDCFASNEWLAERMEMTPGGISNLIAKLRAAGVLFQTGFDGRRRLLSTKPPQNEATLAKSQDPIEQCSQGTVANGSQEGPLYRENKEENKGENTEALASPPQAEKPVESAPEAPKKTRERNPWFDALVEGCKITPEGARVGASGIAKCAGVLRQANVDPAKVIKIAEAHRKAWPKHPVTPFSIVKNWATLEVALQRAFAPRTLSRVL